MYCQFCGDEVLIKEQRYCPKCGKLTPPSADGESTTPSRGTACLAEIPKIPKPTGVLGWVLFALLALAYMSIALAIYFKSAIPPNNIGSVVLWTGIVLAYFRRKQGRSGWIGFGVGVVAAIATIFSAAMLAGLIRGLLNH